MKVALVLLLLVVTAMLIDDSDAWRRRRRRRRWFRRVVRTVGRVARKIHGVLRPGLKAACLARCRFPIFCNRICDRVGKRGIEDAPVNGIDATSVNLKEFADALAIHSESAEELKRAFKLADKDGNDLLTDNELKLAFGDTLEENEEEDLKNDKELEELNSILQDMDDDDKKKK